MTHARMSIGYREWNKLTSTGQKYAAHTCFVYPLIMLSETAKGGKKKSGILLNVSYLDQCACTTRKFALNVCFSLAETLSTESIRHEN